jgi:hypothetical protein
LLLAHAAWIEAEILADFAKQNPQGLERIARFFAAQRQKVRPNERNGKTYAALR